MSQCLQVATGSQKENKNRILSEKKQRSITNFEVGENKTDVTLKRWKLSRRWVFILLKYETSDQINHHCTSNSYDWASSFKVELLTHHFLSFHSIFSPRKISFVRKLSIDPVVAWTLNEKSENFCSLILYSIDHIRISNLSYTTRTPFYMHTNTQESRHCPVSPNPVYVRPSESFK